MKIGLRQEEQVQDAATNQVDNQRKHTSRANAADSGRKLSEVFQGVETVLPAGASGMEIHQVACDSRKVRPGALFFALHGAKADGNKFIQDALKRGAVAIASEEPAQGTIPAGVVWIQVREARKALAITAANFLGHPANALQLVAVTGTNGKTMRDVTEICLRLGLDPILVGSSLATNQTPAAGAQVRRGAKITVQFGTPAPKIAQPRHRVRH